MHAADLTRGADRPIGVFDSGLGGLTVLRELRRRLPREDFVYLADSANAPYGGRPIEHILAITDHNIDFLLRRDVKMIVIACNTASSSAYERARALAAPTPVIGVIMPVVREAVARTARLNRPAVVGVLGTEATIESGVFPRFIRQACDRAGLPAPTVMTQACPDFVCLAEAGHWDDELAVRTAGRYLERMKQTPPDVVILGCTHYPLLSPAIRCHLPHSVLVESGAAVADKVALKLAQSELASASEGGTCRFYSTKPSDAFRSFASTILNREIERIESADPGAKGAR